MQQTEYLKLNLIEGSDSVDWAPLNENAKLLEAEAAALGTELKALTTALGSGGKTCRIAVGSYTGTGVSGADNPNTLTFDFCPALVILRTPGVYYNGVFIRGSSLGTNCWNQYDQVNLTWGDDYVSWYSTVGPEVQNNASGYTFYYVAIGYSN